MRRKNVIRKILYSLTKKGGSRDDELRRKKSQEKSMKNSLRASEEGEETNQVSEKEMRLLTSAVRQLV